MFNIALPLYLRILILTVCQLVNKNYQPYKITDHRFVIIFIIINTMIFFNKCTIREFSKIQFVAKMHSPSISNPARGWLFQASFEGC